MDFELTDEQRLLCASIAEFARNELNDDVLARDRSGTFARDAWRKCAEIGLQGLPVAVEYGGQGADYLTTMLALESLGHACTDNGLIFSLNAQMWACQTPIQHFGSEEQKQRYLPALCDGSLIAAHGMSEPDSGSDAFAMRTAAEARDGKYVLNGTKTFASNAPESDLFVVFATADPAGGFATLCAFLIERGTPGFTVGPPISKMGLRTSPMSELFFENCEVTPERMLGARGAGMAIFNHSMLYERSCILASTVGTMRRQLERSLDYARQRKQFGQPIGSFQAISRMLVDMRLRVETAQLLLYRLGWLLDQKKPATLESALTKLYLSESFVRSSLDALQIHGGYGFMSEYELERDVRDAIGSRLYSGTSEIQYNIVARNMGL
jgi:alkylation response protein AidB-like acyl-CoA dehydrogenase